MMAYENKKNSKFKHNKVTNFLFMSNIALFSYILKTE